MDNRLFKDAGKSWALVCRCVNQGQGKKVEYRNYQKTLDKLGITKTR